MLATIALALATTTPIDDLITRYEKLGRFSGAVLVARDGQVVHAKGYGLANREHRVPNRGDTRFMIGSLAKQFTAAAILKLEQDGKLSTADTISKHLPDYPKAQGEKVTIHHLLTHTSGIPSYGRRGDGLDALEKMQATAVKLDEILAHSSGRELLHEAGTKYRYSNTGYAILARIVERVSGQPFEDYLRDAIFGPAGLRDTGVLKEGEVVPRLADPYVGYEPDVRRAPFTHPSWNVGAGNAFTTVRDLYRWDQVLSTDAVLNAAEREKFIAPHTKRSGAGHYAYGWFLDEIDGRRVISHGGTAEGWVCEMYRLPDQKITVIVLSNHLVKLGVHVPGEIAEAAVRMLMGEEPGSVPPMPVELKPAHRQLAGNYEVAPGRRVVVQWRDGRLFARTEGQEPWTLFTWRGGRTVNREAKPVARALEFVDRLRTGKYEAVVAMLVPSWAEKSTPDSFRAPWEKWIGQWGALEAAVPFELVERETIDIVTMLLRFQRRDVHLEVVMGKNGEIAGWWEMAGVPQREVEIVPAADGTFFADGFASRLPDVRVRISPGRFEIVP